MVLIDVVYPLEGLPERECTYTFSPPNPPPSPIEELGSHSGWATVWTPGVSVQIIRQVPILAACFVPAMCDLGHQCFCVFMLCLSQRSMLRVMWRAGSAHSLWDDAIVSYDRSLLPLGNLGTIGEWRDCVVTSCPCSVSDSRCRPSGGYEASIPSAGGRGNYCHCVL